MKLFSDEVLGSGIKEVVFMHAHPDDEAFLTGGTISLLGTYGVSCHVIYLAAGLVPKTKLTNVRRAEAEAANSLLRTKSTAYLDYTEPRYVSDSSVSLIGANADDIFHDISKLLLLASEGRPYILVGYDKNGGYGNTDHKIVHRVGSRICETGPEKMLHYYEATINRDKYNELLNEKSGSEDAHLPDLRYWANEYGTMQAGITHKVDLSKEALIAKRGALECHASQMNDQTFPLSLGQQDFKRFFGEEFYIKQAG